MSGKNVMFDVDGVLADFVLGFTQLAVAEGFMETVIKTTEQPSWDFGQVLSEKQQKQLWTLIDHRGSWWESLQPLVPAETFERINKLCDNDVVTFCTHRLAGMPHAQVQTQAWLMRHGIDIPNVVVSKRKGEVARALDIDYAIDDKPENAACIHWISDVRPTKSYILDRPYNHNADLPRRIKRVLTVDEFLDDIERGV